ncbi:hypothetical protein WJX82_003317 [Trebouxia sp. C0006]
MLTAYVQLVTETPDDNAALSLRRRSKYRLGKDTRQGIKIGIRPTTQRRQVVTMGIFGLGGPEIAVIAGVAVLIFGPSKIPGLGKEVGKAAKSFQQAAKEFENELKSDAADAEQKVDASRKEKQQ